MDRVGGRPMPKRRTTILGLGALAMGSGAAFTSAAFADSATADADLRAVVETNLRVGPGDDAGNEDNITTDGDKSDFFEGGELNDDVFDEEQDPPLAYVDGENDELEIKTAVPVGEQVTFSGLLEINNDNIDPVTIGIAYDRDSDDGNQYGEDIDVGDNDEGVLDPEVTRRSHQFRVNEGLTFREGDETPDGLISPSVDGGSANVGSDVTIEQEFDRPANAVVLDPGQSIQVDLEIDLETDQGAIEDAADLNTNVFGFQQDTVQLISGFTVGTLTDEE